MSYLNHNCFSLQHQKKNSNNHYVMGINFYNCKLQIDILFEECKLLVVIQWWYTVGED